jgi:hypothetical protein
MSSLAALETVAKNVTTGDGGNNWGAHKSRIVQTARGVFTVFTLDGEGYLAREWHLARKTDDDWDIVKQGVAGREPPNLLAGPDGTLYVIAWPDGQPHIWAGADTGDGLEWRDEAVRGDWSKTDWPYSAAAVSPHGEIAIVTSLGDKPGKFQWAHGVPFSERWKSETFATDFRFAYVFPFATERGLWFLGERDVLWKSLGWTRPENAFTYVFDGLRYWYSPDVRQGEFASGDLRDEPQTEEYPMVSCYQVDVYEDLRGRMHVLYNRRGASTSGKTIGYHLLMEKAGRVLWDVTLPQAAQWRMTQDLAGKFYLLMNQGSDLLVYSSRDEEGRTPGEPVRLPLGKTLSSYWYVAAPRNGSERTNRVDAAGLTSAGDWIYFSINLV